MSSIRNVADRNLCLPSCSRDGRFSGEVMSLFASLERIWRVGKMRRR
jgi:hypothetical protein